MPTSNRPARPTDPIADTVDAALGRGHRDDPIRPRTGGPAGNARLTAWLGLTLLVVFAAEGITLIGVGRLMTWHVLIGALLVPLTVAKTATTGWRIARYYLGSPDYRQAGPPPLLLRLLGPLVILTALAVLGTGLALIPLGDASFNNVVTVGGFGVSAVTLHQAAFVAWLAVTTVHVLTRTIPALRSASGATPGATVPGGAARAVVLAATGLVGLAVGLVVVHFAGDWIHHRIGHQKFGHFGVNFDRPASK
jgi:hypothetical protein